MHMFDQQSTRIDGVTLAQHRFAQQDRPSRHPREVHHDHSRPQISRMHEITDLLVKCAPYDPLQVGSTCLYF